MTHDRGTSSGHSPGPRSPGRWLLLLTPSLVLLALAGWLVQGRSGTADPSPTAVPSQPSTEQSAPSRSLVTTAPSATMSRPSSSAATKSTDAPKPPQPPRPSQPTEATETGAPPGTREVRGSLEDTLQVTEGVGVRVSDITAVRGEAAGVGEVRGPALRISLTVENQTRRPLDLDLALVNIYHGRDRTPAAALSGPGAVPFPSVLSSGRSATAQLVFAVPEDDRDDLQVEFAYNTSTARAVFEGSSDDV